MGEEIEFENGPKWPNFRLSRAPDLDLDLGSGSRSYRCAPVIEYYLYTKFHRNGRNFLWMDGRTYERKLPPIVLGRLPKFGSRPKNGQQDDEMKLYYTEWSNVQSYPADTETSQITETCD